MKKFYVLLLLTFVCLTVGCSEQPDQLASNVTLDRQSILHLPIVKIIKKYIQATRHPEYKKRAREALNFFIAEFFLDFDLSDSEKNALKSLFEGLKFYTANAIEIHRAELSFKNEIRDINNGDEVNELLNDKYQILNESEKVTQQIIADIIHLCHLKDAKNINIRINSDEFTTF